MSFSFSFFFLQYILLSSLEQWRTTVTANSVKILLLNDDLTESLTLSLAEVTVLWESDLILKQSNDKDNLNMEQDFYNPFTNKLVSICTKLVEARKLLKNEEYDKIVELYTADYFKFSLILTGRMSIIPLVPKILKYASEEILIIVAESRNIKCENLLRASFEVFFSICCICRLLFALLMFCISFYLYLQPDGFGDRYSW